MATFNAVALAIGLIIMLSARLSGLVNRSFLSLTVIFVAGGFVIGDGALGFLEIDSHTAALKPLAIGVLVLILFVDDLEVDHELVRSDWRVPLKKLLVAMPLTMALVAVLAYALTDMSWTLCFLLGALIAPTDPILSSSVITNKLVPQRVRHSLSLESGLNDGLALPVILALSASLVGESFDLLSFLVRDLGLGVLVGVAVGFAAAKFMPTRADDPDLPPHAKSLYAVGCAFALYGLASAVHGNGLIAVFVGAVVLGSLRPDIERVVHELSQDMVELAKLIVFVVFGALLTVPMLAEIGLPGVLLVAAIFVIARPVAVLVSLAGERMPMSHKLFMGWFGARGIATVAFSLLVLSKGVPGSEQLFVLCAATVFCSVLVHGLSDGAGVRWIARRTEQPQP